MGFACLPAFTTFGKFASGFPAPGELAEGDVSGEQGGVARGPEADLGEVGEEEEAESEDRFLRPTGTGLGAEVCGDEPALAFGLEPEGTEAAAAAEENKVA